MMGNVTPWMARLKSRYVKIDVDFGFVALGCGAPASPARRRPGSSRTS